MGFGVIRRIANATQALAGLMSAADKTKLDGIAAGATATEQPQDNLSSESTTAPLSANQGRVLKGLIDGDGILSASYTLAITADSEYIMVARKYGRIVVLTCNTGSAVTTAIPAQKVLCTLAQEYRPAGGCWAVISLANGETARITITSSGVVTLQDAVPTGKYPRFTVAYTSLT